MNETTRLPGTGWLRVKRLLMGALWTLAAGFLGLVCAAPVWADGELPPGAGTPGKAFAITVVGVVVALVTLISWRTLRRMAKARKDAEEAAAAYARYHGHPPEEEP